MIIPNLMVSDMARSLDFYRNKLGLELVTAISARREVLQDTDGSDAIFAILAGQGGQLMLQLAPNFREELPQLAAAPSFTGTIYMRGLDPRPITPRVAAAEIVKPVALQWYGMLEGYFRDPDGYIVCAGVTAEPPVA